LITLLAARRRLVWIDGVGGWLLQRMLRDSELVDGRRYLMFQAAEKAIRKTASGQPIFDFFCDSGEFIAVCS